jgi:hypothetical protein
VRLIGGLLNGFPLLRAGFLFEHLAITLLCNRFRWAAFLADGLAASRLVMVSSSAVQNLVDAPRWETRRTWCLASAKTDRLQVFAISL